MYGTRAAFNSGNTVVLDLGNGIILSPISIQWSTIDQDPFDQFDLVPEDFHLILLRFKTHFRCIYTPLREDIPFVD